MNRVLTILQQQGQMLSGELAKLAGMSERALHEEIYPHTIRGDVMSCKIIRGGKTVCVEYRMGGTFPKVRPGPKVGGHTA